MLAVIASDKNGRVPAGIEGARKQNGFDRHAEGALGILSKNAHVHSLTLNRSVSLPAVVIFHCPGLGQVLE